MFFKAVSILLIASSIVSCSTSNVKVAGEKNSGLKFTPVVESTRPFMYVAWNKNFDVDFDAGNPSVALNSPVIFKDRVIVGDITGVVRGYNLKNGKLVWEKKDNGAYHAGVLAYGDTAVYGDVYGRLYSRSIDDGTLIYSVDLGSSVETTPVYHNGRLLVQTRDHRLVCLDATTGKILWSYKRSVPFLTTVQRASRPYVEKNKIYMGFADGNVIAFNIEEGMVLWENKISDGSKFIDVDSTPVKFGKMLVVSSIAGNIAVINPVTGLINARLPYIASRSPLADGDQLIVGTVDGEVVKLNSDYKKVATYKVSKSLITDIVKFKNHYVVSTVGGEIVALNADTLKPVYHWHLGHANSAIYGTIATGEENIAVLSSRSRLYVFR